MTQVPPVTQTHNRISAELSARVAREKAAHEDDRIDEVLQRWWGWFPHVFRNPSMKSLNEYYMQELGDVRDKVVLEYGCGKGNFASWLVGLGARVVGIDISEFNIAHCENKFRQQSVNAKRYKFCVMDAHQLQFPDGSFDFVVGNGIIHHLELAIALKEVDRVLRPGGKALFQEPLDDNPLLKLYRWLARFQTNDECPLGHKDLDYLKTNWNIRARYSGLITMPIGVVTSILMRSFPDNWPLRLAARLEEALNGHHVLDHWNRFVVLVYEKPVRG
jgi:SAM-dependent methyltransferase